MVSKLSENLIKMKQKKKNLYVWQRAEPIAVDAIRNIAPANQIIMITVKLISGKF